MIMGIIRLMATKVMAITVMEVVMVRTVNIL